MTSEPGIRVRVGGEGWTAPESRAYENERHLQALIAEEPSWVPGVAPDSLTAQELATIGGPIDVCIVGRGGELTVVECKLASNSERRRMVVGQVIDYAAAIWLERSTSFFEAWERNTGRPLAAELDDDALVNLEANIASSKIDLCLAVDEIDDDLRRLVEYLNQVTRPDIRVTALQLAYVRHGEVEILIPSTFGGEIAEAKVRSSQRGGEPWTKESFIEALDSEADRAFAARLFEEVEALGDQRGPRSPLWFGQRPRGGVYLHLYGLDIPPAWVSVNSRGQLTICGTWKSFPSVAHDDSYSPLAAALGQSHLEGAKGMPVSSLDLEQLWPVLTQCAESINRAAGRRPGIEL